MRDDLYVVKLLIRDPSGFGDLALGKLQLQQTIDAELQLSNDFPYQIEGVSVETIEEAVL